MLPSALLTAADRLAAILMALVDAISPIALAGSTPTFPGHAAQTLFFRLAHLVTTLIRISNFGIRAPAKPATPKATTQAAPTTQRPHAAQTLPRHPGWLLAALPDIAPALAADLAALLADPALTALLAASPTLHRTLRPLLRGLGLHQPPPSPDAPPPRRPAPKTRPQSPHPAHSAPTPARPAVQTAAPNHPNQHSTFLRPFCCDIET